MTNKVAWLICGFAVFVGGCSTLPASTPDVQIKEVQVPVPVPCVDKSFPAPPAYSDNDKALREAGGADARYQLLVQGRQERIARERKVEQVINTCKG